MMSQVHVIVMRGQRLAALCWQWNLNRGIGEKDILKDANQDCLLFWAMFGDLEFFSDIDFYLKVHTILLKLVF